ncbi:MAG: peroxiredoxin [Hyphomicrobiales bacterium]
MTNLAKPDWTTIAPPVDDGAADHLVGMPLPNVKLATTDDTYVSLASLRGILVLYIYPMTGSPDKALPDNWDAIPGARGCTPQSCSFRDHFEELKTHGVAHLFGLSTQDTKYQKEAAARLHLPFALLSDEALTFAKALKLPTFEVDDMTLLKRMSMIVRDGVIVKTFYPIFPPDQDAEQIIQHLLDA